MTTCRIWLAALVAGALGSSGFLGFGAVLGGHSRGLYVAAVAVGAGLAGCGFLLMLALAAARPGLALDEHGAARAILEADLRDGRPRLAAVARFVNSFPVRAAQPLERVVLEWLAGHLEALRRSAEEHSRRGDLARVRFGPEAFAPHDAFWTASQVLDAVYGILARGQAPALGGRGAAGAGLDRPWTVADPRSAR